MLNSPLIYIDPSGNVLKKEKFVVDTYTIRILYRLGLINKIQLLIQYSIIFELFAKINLMLQLANEGSRSCELTEPGNCWLNKRQLFD